jgi:hypothetical protein
VVLVTARARVLGKHNDGTVRRFGFQAQAQTIHLLPDTGNLAYCGATVTGITRPQAADALLLEAGLDPARKRWRMCGDCTRLSSPQPDPAIWGPYRQDTGT